MLISQNWLTKLIGHANPGWQATAADLDAGFVRVGFETEGYANIPETTGKLVLGKVAEITELTGFKKPIRYCQVDVGSANGTGELQGIICGARNFETGDLVAVALPGAVLPGNFEISARETYGHISAGMICSASELGLTDKPTSGIINLGKDLNSLHLELGADLQEFLGLDDTIFDVNITPDRGYALSARGLVREVASAFNLNLVDIAATPAAIGCDIKVPDTLTKGPEVKLATETKTRRFGILKVSEIDSAAQTPFWIQRELLICGARPVNLATDITNYVMFLLGQPMHAFDAAKINGSIDIRYAQAGETLTTLDGVERKLDPADVVIADETGIQSLAGVMGGANSEISDNTTEVYLEAANWDALTVARTSRRLKLTSEASRRFERGVDPQLIEISLDLAASLLVTYGGGRVSSEKVLVGETPAMPVIEMRTSKPSEIAGVDYSLDTVTKRLEEVGCAVTHVGENFQIIPPSWRPDLNIPADLVEEVLRLEGLEDIPSVLPTPRGGHGYTQVQRRRRAVGHALAYGGYAEILPTPFIATDTFDIWELPADDPRRNVVKVQNPLESHHSIIGTTLLPSMLEAVGRNVSRGRTDLSLFGLQQVAFARAEKSPMLDVTARPEESALSQLLNSLPEQPLHVATVGTGNIEYQGPWGEGRSYTFADAIESARIVSRAAGVDLEVRAGQNLPWHPGRCAELLVDSVVVGYAGELHPQILQRLNLPARTCAMELDLNALPVVEKLPAPVLSAYPALHQDIALVVSEEVPAEEVRKAISAGAGELLEEVKLFDIYRSEQLGAGKKSLAFSMLFRAPDRTLTDAEANEARLQAAQLAAERFNAEMRA
ncbi:phenylalanine--tRNA ligase subunit beta [Corynebacterium caspium]|uniref:phenylalanine--tRNA ligase subunit beta n=1 Tax=Corynebacterium caspium TaxID=234828 RepID=UPI000363D4CE|nr:phenylalanine--tRNA ligase subunit beta [Corynebacterium caspium]WKD59369.1 Phenylalanine--tRNA ligase beta subunit [Corynebacterium caspium DSM 44850]